MYLWNSQSRKNTNGLSSLGMQKKWYKIANQIFIKLETWPKPGNPFSIAFSDAYLGIGIIVEPKIYILELLDRNFVVIFARNGLKISKKKNEKLQNSWNFYKNKIKQWNRVEKVIKGDEKWQIAKKTTSNLIWNDFFSSYFDILKLSWSEFSQFCTSNNHRL